MDKTIDETSKLLTLEPIRKNQRVSRNTSRIEIHKLDNLIPYKDHPFALYEGQRFTDMVESVRTNGVTRIF